MLVYEEVDAVIEEVDEMIDRRCVVIEQCTIFVDGEDIIFFVFFISRSDKSILVCNIINDIERYNMFVFAGSVS